MPETLTKPYLKHVAFVEPQSNVYPGFQGIVRTEPLGLEYIAGAICPLDPDKPRLAESVTIYDDRVLPGEWLEGMRQNPPDMVGIRLSYTADVTRVHQLARAIKKEVGPDIPILVGGHHASLRPADMFIKEIAAVAIGQGEEIMKKAVQEWGEKHSLEGLEGVWYQGKDGEFHPNLIRRKGGRVFESDSCLMNERPLPRRDLVEKYRNGYYFLYYPEVASMETTRGCVANCGFCSVWRFHEGNFLVQSAERTVEEIASLAANGTKYITNIDDLAFHPLPRINPKTGIKELYNPGRDIAEGLKRRGLSGKVRFWGQIRADDVYPKDPELRPWAEETFAMLAEAGFDMALVGVESLVNDEDLKAENKGTDLETNNNAIKILKKLGIRVWAAQIIRPEWDIEDYDRVIEANRALEIEAPQFTNLTPLPGSVDYGRKLRSGKIKAFHPSRYNFFDWVEETRLPEGVTHEQNARLNRETGGGTTLIRRAVQDLREGRTTNYWIRTFGGNFAVMQDPKAHLERIIPVDPAEEEMWKDRITNSRHSTM